MGVPGPPDLAMAGREVAVALRQDSRETRNKPSPKPPRESLASAHDCLGLHLLAISF